MVWRNLRDDSIMQCRAASQSAIRDAKYKNLLNYLMLTRLAAQLARHKIDRMIPGLGKYI
jgi:hypothetical protein